MQTKQIILLVDVDSNEIMPQSQHAMMQKKGDLFLLRYFYRAHISVPGAVIVSFLSL